MPNDKSRGHLRPGYGVVHARWVEHSGFGLRHSFVIRHLSFVIFFLLLVCSSPAAELALPVSPYAVGPTNTAWEASYQARLTNLVFARTWSIGSGAADPDDGKRMWPQLLAEMWKVRSNTTAVANYINNQGRTLILSKYAGTYYKPFSCPGHALYARLFWNQLPAEQTARIAAMLNSPATNSTPCGNLVETGWQQMRRADSHMDPIYCLTEFNSENFNWMARLTGYVWSEHYAEAAQQAWFGGYVSNWTRAFFHAGRLEWNSNNYWGYTFQPILVLHEYAADPQVKARAKAALDWMLLEAALHYLDGFQAGPDVRGKSDAYKPFAGSVWPYAYLYFAGDGHAPTYSVAAAQTNMNRDLVGYAPWLSYRPPQVVLDLANRKFTLPVEMQNAKPFYDLDQDNYADWAGNTPRSRRFEFETIYYDTNYLLASVATLRPDGDATAVTQGQKPFSEQVLWRLAVKGTTNGALQLIGNAGPRTTAAARWPHEQIGQYRNVMLRMAKSTDRLWVAAPDSRPFEFNGHEAFCDLGNGVYAAFRAFNATNHATTDFAPDTNYTQPTWFYPSNQLVALALEVGVQRDYGSYAAFKAAVNGGASFATPAPDQLEYTSPTGRKLKLQHQPPTTYTMKDGTFINPAGVLPRVWRDGVETDFASWDCYRVSFGDNIVDQRWGGGAVTMAAGGRKLRIKTDPATAVVDYEQLVSVPDITLAASVAPHPATGQPHLRIRYQRPAGGGGLDYTVETSTTLADWTNAAGAFETLSITPDPGGQTETVVLRSLAPVTSGGRKFTRLKMSGL